MFWITGEHWYTVYLGGVVASGAKLSVLSIMAWFDDLPYCFCTVARGHTLTPVYCLTKVVQHRVQYCLGSSRRYERICYLSSVK